MLRRLIRWDQWTGDKNNILWVFLQLLCERCLIEYITPGNSIESLRERLHNEMRRGKGFRMRPYSCIDGAMKSLCIQVVDASRTIRHRWWFRCGSLLRTAMWVVWVQTLLRKPLVWGSQRGSTHAVGQLTCKDFNKVNIKASRSIWGASKSSHRTKCRWMGRICSWLYRHSIAWLLEKPCTIHLLINEIAEESLHVFEYSIRLLRIVYILDDLNESVNKQP